eukprot:scaffold18612_cov118-Isochrysis_galbana.AAC.11
MPTCLSPRCVLCSAPPPLWADADAEAGVGQKCGGTGAASAASLSRLDVVSRVTYVTSFILA